MIGLFDENGPLTITKNGTNTVALGIRSGSWVE